MGMEAGIASTTSAAFKKLDASAIALLQAGFLRLSHQMLRENQAQNSAANSTFIWFEEMHSQAKIGNFDISLLRRLADVGTTCCSNSRRTLQESISELQIHRGPVLPEAK